jgi:hypothetical protein
LKILDAEAEFFLSRDDTVVVHEHHRLHGEIGLFLSVVDARREKVAGVEEEDVGGRRVAKHPHEGCAPAQPAQVVRRAPARANLAAHVVGVNDDEVFGPALERVAGAKQRRDRDTGRRQDRRKLEDAKQAIHRRRRERSILHDVAPGVPTSDRVFCFGCGAGPVSGQNP